jgi:hypothetical protein
MADYSAAYNGNASCFSCDFKTTQGQGVTYGSCPVWMADGRSFGDVVYQPRCGQQYEQKFPTNFDYRLYLIQNAENIMKENTVKATSRLQKW